MVAVIFEHIYHKDKDLIKRIEQQWGKIKYKRKKYRYDPIQDDPELRKLDRLMREVPRGRVY